MAANHHNNHSNNHGNHGKQQADQQARRGNRRRKAKRGANPDEFWGDRSKLPQDKPKIRIITDPPAVIRSLGRPPLSGQQNHADAFFAAVYQRSVTLASVLAAAGNLIAPDELVGDRLSDDD